MNPAARISKLELVTEEERRQLVDGWSLTGTAPPSDLCVHDLIEAQSRRTPDAIAVVHEAAHLTYAELDCCANQLAHHLRSRGVEPEVRVGIFVERSLEMMVGLLGVLKAGGAYVPLDPGYPEDRLRYVLEDSMPAIVLTQRSLMNRLGVARMQLVLLDQDVEPWSTEPTTSPERAGLDADHVMYVIYTSGSTGQPKGVTVCHRSAVNVLTWMQDLWRLEPADAVLQKTSYSFDASIRELLTPLIVGGRLVLARAGGQRDSGYILATVRREKVDTLHLVPSLLRVLVEDPSFPSCVSLRRVVCGGEALPQELVRQFHARLPQASLYNVYGPTEVTVDVSAWECSQEAIENGISIGGPMANTRLYVLDQHGEATPIGIVGELYLGGVQLARGYWNRPELTAERFLPDPFGRGPGLRLYRTGDLGRWRSDGTIELTGRNDGQVKIRGFRIELGEVEAVLREYEGVRDCLVEPRVDK